MSEDSTLRSYSCRRCGASYIAYPPDDVHTRANCRQSDDAVEITYTCPSCKLENKLWWELRPLTG